MIASETELSFGVVFLVRTPAMGVDFSFEVGFRFFRHQKMLAQQLQLSETEKATEIKFQGNRH